MSTCPHSSTPASHTVYASPCGRVVVVRHGPRDYRLHLDGVCVQSFPFAYQAEHAGSVWLDEQAKAPAARQTDAQPEHDAAQLADELPDLPVVMARRRSLEEDFEWTEYCVGAATVVFEDDGRIDFWHDDVEEPADLVALMVLLSHPVVRRRVLQAFRAAGSG